MCPRGRYQNRARKSSCIAAPAGRYIPSTGYKSYLCVPAGFYQPYSGRWYKYQYRCPRGRYSRGCARACTYCAKGYYQPYTGRSSCYSAPAGRYVSGTGRWYVTSIPRGYYNPYSRQTSGYRFKCPAGTYSTGSARSCTSCPRGRYSGAGRYYCTLCAKGYYNPYTRRSRCYAVPAGRYASRTGSYAMNKWVYVVPRGYYSPRAGLNYPYRYACPSGKWSSAGARSCTSASKGYYTYSSKAAGYQRRCPVGKWANGGDRFCFSATPGRYCPKTGMSYTLAIPAGYYNPYSNQRYPTRFKWPRGKYSKAGARACSTCPRGYYSNSSATAACKKCPVGSYARYGTGTCSIAPAGRYVTNTASRKTLAIPPGYYNPNSGQNSCCKYRCPSGKYSSGGAKSCTYCQRGRYQSKTGQRTCLGCPRGNYCQCRTGYWSGCTKPTLTPAGYYQPYTYRYIAKQYRCGAGYYSRAGARSCSKCAAGKYTSRNGCRKVYI